MKIKYCSKIVMCLLAMLVMSGWVLAYSGGSGTEVDPYIINTPDDIVELGGNVGDYDKYFIVTSDIDMGVKGTFTGAVIAAHNDDTNYYTFKGTRFTGNFNGNGHIINNLSIVGVHYCGLFGSVGYGGVVSGLGLENVSITSSGVFVGGLCGKNIGTINNSYVRGSINGFQAVGVLCGENWIGKIVRSHSSGSVAGEGAFVGGLCGRNDSGSITDSYAKVIVDGSYRVGGLCGENYYGSVNSSYASGNVTGSGVYVGGLCGTNSGNITNSYASGSVSGVEDVGGLCGSNNRGNVTGSYASGNVYGDEYVGGLCGSDLVSGVANSYACGSVTSSGVFVGGLCGCLYGNSANIKNSFWDIQTSGQDFGYVLDPATPGTITNVQGKITAEMQIQTTFTAADWDFSTTDGDSADWAMRSGSYPLLLWQIVPGDIGGTFGVNLQDIEIMANNWLAETPGMSADVNSDGKVDLLDFATVAANWLK